MTVTQQSRVCRNFTGSALSCLPYLSLLLQMYSQTGWLYFDCVGWLGFFFFLNFSGLRTEVFYVLSFYGDTKETLDIWHQSNLYRQGSGSHWQASSRVLPCVSCSHMAIGEVQQQRVHQWAWQGEALHLYGAWETWLTLLDTTWPHHWALWSSHTCCWAHWGSAIAL